MTSIVNSVVQVCNKTHLRLAIKRTWIPNSVTALSVFLGYLSIVYTFEGFYVTAAWLVVLAAILDSMDGRLARKLGAGTKFGSYFDSLADAINYGAAPSRTPICKSTK
ncbi:MAG: CDP-alcohol phosphatidyltransferase family protein [Anaerolineae bacterium]